MKHKEITQQPWHLLFYGFLFFAFMILNGCSTVTKDGPPRYDVDVSNIPDAKPKVEPLSKTGNLPTYRVFGKKYHTMPSAKNYHEIGTASWYGTKFHHHTTSSGEPYDMLAMTAAHKTLPLPTYVQVTNLSNHRKVIVKVNDRGPFEGSRIIDLSYAAAKKLGMLGHGTAKVSIVAIDPRQYNREKSTTPVFFAENRKTYPSTKNKYVTHSRPAIYLQVAAFKNKINAEKLRRQLSPIVSSPIHITSMKKLYRVQIGPINDQTHIAQINRKLRQLGLTSKQLLA